MRCFNKKYNPISNGIGISKRTIKYFQLVTNMRTIFSRKKNTKLVMLFLINILDVLPFLISHIVIEAIVIPLNTNTLIKRAYSKENINPFSIADIIKAIDSHMTALKGKGKKSLNAFIQLLPFIILLLTLFISTIVY